MLVVTNNTARQKYFEGGENVYRVDLDLDAVEVKQLRQLALDRDTSVRGLVTNLVKQEIQEDKNKKKEVK